MRRFQFLSVQLHFWLQYEDIIGAHVVVAHSHQSGVINERQKHELLQHDATQQLTTHTKSKVKKYNIDHICIDD